MNSSGENIPLNLTVVDGLNTAASLIKFGVPGGIAAGVFMVGAALYHFCVLKKYVRQFTQTRLDHFTMLYVNNSPETEAPVDSSSRYPSISSEHNSPRTLDKDEDLSDDFV